MVAIKQIIMTTGSNITCIFPQDASYLAPCDHEKTGARMILRLAGAVNKGFYERFIMRCGY